jgi:acyl-CoA thioester hydrolase
MRVTEGRVLHQVDFPVRWGDMDALGYVNNRVYFQYFEIARLSWFESLGFAPLATTREGMVIVDNHAQYLKPVVYPMHVVVLMRGHSPGRSSFISTYTLMVDDQIYTTGSAKIVWIDTQAGKSVPLPETIRALVSQ